MSSERSVDPKDPAGDTTPSKAVLFDVLYKGKPWEKLLMTLGLISTGVSIILLFALMGGYPGNNVLLTAFAAALGAVVSVSVAGASFEYSKEQRRLESIRVMQEEVNSDHAKPRLAWDLARTKLESYLDRNLRQVSSIYYLTVIVMFCGMGLIGFGVWRAITFPSAMQAAGLAALAGVVVQIIGGTILLVYRSTMAQANGYVVVLERINAVGMSINILEGIETATESRDAARVQLSTSLLSMYATGQNTASVGKRRSSKTGSRTA